MRGLIDILALIFVAAVFAVVILEAAHGCGQFYTDADGVRHLGECIWLRR